MLALCDLPGRRLVIACEPCGRRGDYSLERLRRRFGPHASEWDVYLALTQSCRYQRERGSRSPNQYGISCRAKLMDDGLRRTSNPCSRA